MCVSIPFLPSTMFYRNIKQCIMTVKQITYSKGCTMQTTSSYSITLMEGVMQAAYNLARGVTQVLLGHDSSMTQV